jgi:hypothetical protein
MFGQSPEPWDDPSYVRYCPGLNIWVSPLAKTEKTKKCSAIDGGKYRWRLDEIDRLNGIIKDIDLYGNAYHKPLQGYHGVGNHGYGNDKYMALESYAFSLAIERRCASDYWTEKFADPILCNTVPIYSGATNIKDYTVDGSYISAEDVANIDWNHWQVLYQKHLPFVLQQKEIIRTKFNYFSYFVRILKSPKLLENKRPITLQDG